jgi:hypothetical protein
MDTIACLDNETLLIVAGSHGAKYDGWHGGSSKDEMSSVFFAYSKSGFPILKYADSLKQSM